LAEGERVVGDAVGRFHAWDGQKGLDGDGDGEGRSFEAETDGQRDRIEDLIVVARECDVEGQRLAGLGAQGTGGERGVDGCVGREDDLQVAAA
jgi:hypothetical protein